MSLRKLSPLFRLIFALLILAVAMVLLFKGASGPMNAQSPSVQERQVKITGASRRLFENRVPERLPIRVKIKHGKEKSYRDLNNENWARDFEIEVQNTGNKPIYSLAFLLEVPDAKIGDSYQAFTIVYGRAELFDLNTSPGTDDVPIKPNETKTLALAETAILGWDQARGSGLVPRQIRGARLIFQRLSFGDGTGFDGATGTPPSKSAKQSFARNCRPSNDRYGGTTTRRGFLADVRDVGNIASSVNAGIFFAGFFFS